MSAGGEQLGRVAQAILASACFLAAAWPQTPASQIGREVAIPWPGCPRSGRRRIRVVGGRSTIRYVH